jgi:hypothetical protein
MTHQWPHSQQSRGLFTSPPSAGLPYPSYTPHPSRTNTPAYSVSRSSSSSNNSFGPTHSIGHSSIGKSSKHSWKALLQPKRSQTAPWKGTPYISSNRNPNSSSMSYLPYYQQAPGWSTAQYEPLPPPMPSYHPTSNCKLCSCWLTPPGDGEDSPRLLLTYTLLPRGRIRLLRSAFRGH